MSEGIARPAAAPAPQAHAGLRRGLDRLTSAIKTGTTRGWTYDANGNRLTETGASASTYTISGTNNRISAISGAVARTYTYNAVGSALTYSNITATYNNRGRMKTLKKGSTTATFTYNALGELVKRVGGTPGTVHYVYDEAGHLLGEYNSTGALVQETIWLGDTPVATLRPGTPVGIFYVHTDHLNTPRKVTRPSDNNARWTWESDPFGTATPNENPQSLGAFKYNLRFPGQLYDAHTGLNYNYFRDYDAVTGRYIQSDPIGLNGGVNTYGYVAGNPVSLIDPAGLYLSSVHRNFTERGARVAGMTPANAQELAELVVRADIGTQAMSDAHRHAMCAARTTLAVCKERYEKFVESELAKCTKEGLANAIHAMQDSFSRSHRGFQWYGGMIALLLPFGGLDHVLADATPDRNEQFKVPRSTTEMIDNWEGRCSCYAN